MLIEVNDLVKRYDETLALNHFDFFVKKGEIVGLLGPNGSGKTTAINCMLSLIDYQKGDIKIFGEALKPTSYQLKSKIGIVPQDLAILENLTVRENIDYFCGLYISDKTKRKKMVDEAIDFVNLADYQNIRFTKLSGGLKRRLNIACGIAHQPELIFLDEPTVAVDAQSRNFILEGIKQLKTEGKTIVYTTHYLEEAELLCDRVVIMDSGKALADGSVEELQSQINSGEKIVITFSHITAEQFDGLKKLSNIIDASVDGNRIELTFSKGTKPFAEVIEFIERNQLSYESISAVKPTLNEVFLTLTGKELRE